MIEHIQNLEQFGFWVAGYRASLLADPSTPHSDAPAGLFRVNYLQGLPPHLFVLSSPWETIPFSIQERLKMQYEAAKIESERIVHFYISPSRIQMKLMSPLIRETPAGSIDIIGEYGVLIGGLALNIAGTYKGWMIIRKALGEDTFIRKFAESIKDPTNAADLIPPVRRLGAKLQQLKDLARFLGKSRERAIIYP